ncbi:MAG: CbtB-domain containing protein [Chloroflexi bacterium]|nr:CbtB-domain containing protein [Chloroflexota bacterium]
MDAITGGKTKLGLSPLHWGLLAASLVALFLITMDQGQALAAFMGETAYQQNLLHEVFHDFRHAAGLACH